MKALVYTAYGPPEGLRLTEVEKPAPKSNEVLVKVRAASVNSWDWDLLVGQPLARIDAPRKPKYPILGADIAGEVEAVGTGVTRFKPGDAVFGDLTESGWGGFAEYACGRENALVLKPAEISFEDAAAIPQAGLLALQGLRKGRIEAGHKVLVNGAGGGAGTFAIKLAKLFGAEVTGVDHSGKLAAMRAIGADHVIDYTEDDYTRSGKRYDLLLDLVAHRSIFDYRRALTQKGSFVLVGGSTPAILQAAFVGPLLSIAGSKKLGLLVWKPSTGDMDFLKERVASGELSPLIDSVYPLAEGAEALRRTGAGQVIGKVIITP